MYRKSDPQSSSHRSASHPRLPCTHSSSPTSTNSTHPRSSTNYAHAHKPAPRSAPAILPTAFFRFPHKCNSARHTRNSSIPAAVAPHSFPHPPEFAPQRPPPVFARPPSSTPSQEPPRPPPISQPLPQSSRTPPLQIFLPHNHHREPVISLAPHRLNRRGTHSLLCRQHLVQSPHSLNARVFALCINNAAVPHHVVRKDHRPRARQFQRPLKISRIPILIRIQKNQVERSRLFLHQLRHCLRRIADSHFHHSAQSRPHQILLCHFCMLRVVLQRDQFPARRQSSRQPDRAVPSQRPHLQNLPRTNHLRHQHQQLSLTR